MRITIKKVTRFGRDDYFIAEPEHAAWFEKLTRRRNVVKGDVEVLEMLGVDCVVPCTVIFWNYDGPLPAPARLYWNVPQKAHPLSNKGAL